MLTKFFPHYSFRLIPLCALLFILAACGDNSPFDEDYWEETNAEDEQTREEESNRPRAFTATLAAISQNVGNITGAANIRIEQDTVITTTELI